jgi:SPP1 family predicted phage head-tail adaptor
MARAGAYKEEVSIYQTEVKDDGQGGQLVSDVLYWKTSAEVLPITGKQGLEAGQIINGQPYKIRLRFRSDKQANGAMFIKWRGKHLQIHSVVEVSAAKKELEIMAYEGYSHDIIQTEQL